MGSGTVEGMGWVRVPWGEGVGSGSGTMGGRGWLRVPWRVGDGFGYRWGRDGSALRRRATRR